MNDIVINHFTVRYEGRPVPAPYNTGFKFAVNNYGWLLPVGKYKLLDLAAKIREVYSLEADKTAAAVAALEAESIYHDYLNSAPLGCVAGGPVVKNTGATFSNNMGMIARRGLRIDCPHCDCVAKFSQPATESIDWLHKKLHKEYWIMLRHVAEWH